MKIYNAAMIAEMTIEQVAQELTMLSLRSSNAEELLRDKLDALNRGMEVIGEYADLKNWGDLDEMGFMIHQGESTDSCDLGPELAQKYLNTFHQQTNHRN